MIATVVIYTKPGCHLCDVMKQQIAAADCDELFDLQEINIEDHPELLARYRFEIPVLLINGAEAFRHRVTPEVFKQALRTALNHTS